MFTFSKFRPFLQSLSKNSTWHFDITRLISLHFTPRDWKPVAYFVAKYFGDECGIYLFIFLTFIFTRYHFGDTK